MCHFPLGITVGFNDHMLIVKEGVNASINICGFVSSLTGVWKANLSALIVAANCTAKG